MRNSVLSSVLPGVVFFGLLVPLTKQAPILEASFDEASSGLQQYETEMGQSVSLRWTTTSSVQDYIVKLLKYQMDTDSSGVLYIKEEKVLVVTDELLDDRDKARYSLSVTEQEIVFSISVVTPTDEGIYRLEIRRKGGYKQIALAGLQVHKRDGIPETPKSTSENFTFGTQTSNVFTEDDEKVEKDQRYNVDAPESGASTDSSPTLYFAIIGVLAFIIIALGVLFFIWYRRHSSTTNTPRSRSGSEEMDNERNAEKIPLRFDERGINNDALAVYSVIDKTQPRRIAVDKGSAEEVRKKYLAGNLETWVKYCRQTSMENSDLQKELNFSVQNFGIKCGIATPNTDHPSREYKTLMDGFESDPCHNKIIELPFSALGNTHYSQKFVFVRCDRVKDGKMALDMVVMEMSVTENMETTPYQPTDASAEGYDLAFEKVVPPNSVLSQVGDDDKKNYFRYEAVKRLYQEGVIGQEEQEEIVA